MSGQPNEPRRSRVTMDGKDLGEFESMPHTDFGPAYDHIHVRPIGKRLRDFGIHPIKQTLAFPQLTGAMRLLGINLQLALMRNKHGKLKDALLVERVQLIQRRACHRRFGPVRHD